MKVDPMFKRITGIQFFLIELISVRKALGKNHIYSGMINRPVVAGAVLKHYCYSLIK